MKTWKAFVHNTYNLQILPNPVHWIRRTCPLFFISDLAFMEMKPAELMQDFWRLIILLQRKAPRWKDI